MLSQVKKLTDPDGRKEFAGRFGAWWNGHEYVPAPEESEGGDAGATASAASEPDASANGDQAETSGEPAQRLEIPGIPVAEADADGPRIAALERMWGVGRFGPGASDHQVLEALEHAMLEEGDVGMMGADPAFIRAFTKRSDRNLIASEWRSAALERVRRAVPDVTVVSDDVDRAKAFPEESLAALASVNTIAFADHKAGLVSSAYHALKDGGRWVIVDTVRTTPRAPQHAFASSWGEPLLSEESEVDALLEKAGFGEVRKANLTAQMIETARAHMTELGAALEQTVSAGMEGGQGVLFLCELVWELKSWRARLKAFERGALQVVMWTSIKGGVPGVIEDEAVAPAEATEETAGEAPDLAETVEPDAAEPVPEAADDADLELDLDDALFDDPA